MDYAQAQLNAKCSKKARLEVIGTFLSCAFFLTLGLCSPDRYGLSGGEAVFPVSSTIHIAQAVDMPPQIVNRGDGKRAWSVRREATLTNLPQAILEAVRFVLDSPMLLSAEAPPPPPPKLAPLLAHDGSESPRLFIALPAGPGEPLDPKGHPLRWYAQKNVLDAYNIPRPAPFRLPDPVPANQKFAAALARLAPSGNARNYRGLVESFARRYGLNTDLVLAIIHSESNFSPTLVSPKSAIGLMQLLPSTASDEVHRFLYGTRGRISFEQLAVPEINISYGTAYLHILASRYFANVRDRHVREACIIAAYNMGPNGFLKLYGPTPEQAVAKINSMSSDEFHEDLPRRLPHKETRFYVEKVRRMKQHYAANH